MMTLQEKIAKLTAQHDREVAEATRESEILEKLRSIIGAYRPPSVHFYKFYGSRGSLHFKAETYDSLRKKEEKPPDADLLRALLASYPPQPLVRVKDGCTSFRPDLGVSFNTRTDGLTVDEYECYGVSVHVETFQDRTARIQWYTDLDGELWRMEFSVPWYLTDFGTLDMKPHYYGGNGPIANWERCELSPKHDAQRIKWASGAAQYPNSFTLYWDRNSGSKLDFATIAYANQKAQS